MAANLDIKVVTPRDLSPFEKAAWVDLRAQNPALYSPYFHLDYLLLIGELRRDVRVAIAYDGSHPISFFAFQGPRGGFVRPAGAPMTDYHGFIEAPGADIDHTEFLHAAGIGALHYNAMVGGNDDMRGFHQDHFPLCLIDLSQGAKAWRQTQDDSYRRILKKNRRRVRRSEESFGPIRTEYKSNDQTVYDQLIAWKSERFAESGRYDVLSADWTSSLLKSLWRGQEELRCDLHILYFGDEIAAMDLGLTDGETFHSWMVAYNPKFHQYSPGTQLLENLIDQAPELGYKRIDLGASLDSYKSAYANDGLQAHAGFIPVAGAAAALSKVYGAAERLGEKSLKDIPGKLRRRYTQIADCDDTVSGRAKAMLDAVRTGGSN